MFVFNSTDPNICMTVLFGHEAQCVTSPTFYRNLDFWKMDRFVDTLRDQLLKPNRLEGIITIVVAYNIDMIRLPRLLS